MKKSSGPDVAELIGKIQDQLVSLERKVDTLISRAASQPQVRPFDQSRHNDRGREGQGFRDRTLYKIICADCNKQCEIPFKPSPDRPAYCKECFSRRKNSSNSFNPRQENRIVERDFTHEKRSERQKPEEEHVYGKKKVLRKRKKRA
jgi:CxxC-x17-CxxC domain-containing protein